MNPTWLIPSPSYLHWVRAIMWFYHGTFLPPGPIFLTPALSYEISRKLISPSCVNTSPKLIGHPSPHPLSRKPILSSNRIFFPLNNFPSLCIMSTPLHILLFLGSSNTFSINVLIFGPFIQILRLIPTFLFINPLGINVFKKYESLNDRRSFLLFRQPLQTPRSFTNISTRSVSVPLLL